MKLPLQMGFVQIGRERLAGALPAVEQAKYGPQGHENDAGQRKREERPGAEANGIGFREIALPHPHQYQVDTCPRERAHPAHRRPVYHAQHHRLAEFRHQI